MKKITFKKISFSIIISSISTFYISTTPYENQDIRVNASYKNTNLVTPVANKVADAPAVFTARATSFDKKKSVEFSSIATNSELTSSFNDSLSDSFDDTSSSLSKNSNLSSADIEQPEFTDITNDISIDVSSAIDLSNSADEVIKEKFNRNFGLLLLDRILLRAATKGNLSGIRVAIEEGAELNARDDDMNTPLIKAAQEERNIIVRYLVRSGANINAQNDDGVTVLHIAAFYGNTTLIKFLLRNNADTTLMDKNNYLPSDYAISQNNQAVVDLITRFKQ